LLVVLLHLLIFTVNVDYSLLTDARQLKMVRLQCAETAV